MIRPAVLALSLLLSLSLLGGSALAAAGQPQPTAAERREAKLLFDQGHLAYEEASYEEAILKWKRSYELSGEPLIFEAIASAYERLGNVTKAYEYLTQWREHAPPEEHQTLDRRLENLARRMEAAQAEAARQAEQRRREEEQSRAATQRDERRRRRQQRPPGETTGGSDERPSVVPIVSWSLVGVGAAAVVTGVIVDAVAASSRPDEQTACAPSGDQLLCREALQDDIESSNTLAIAGDVTWMVGGAMAATGVVLLLLHSDDASPQQDRAATARIVPSIGRGSASLTVTGAF